MGAYLPCPSPPRKVIYSGNDGEAATGDRLKADGPGSAHSGPPAL